MYITNFKKSKFWYTYNLYPNDKKKKKIFDIQFLAIATNIPVWFMTGRVLQGHIWHLIQRKLLRLLFGLPWMQYMMDIQSN